MQLVENILKEYILARALSYGVLTSAVPVFPLPGPVFVANFEAQRRRAPGETPTTAPGEAPVTAPGEAPVTAPAE